MQNAETDRRQGGGRAGLPIEPRVVRLARVAAAVHMAALTESALNAGCRPGAGLGSAWGPASGAGARIGAGAGFDGRPVEPSA